MIYKSLLENDLIDGIVQDPDEPGVDLDAVEKAIAGEDGIAAHQDEVEDAVEGTIGEPLDEFGMILYESEYNFNQIMEAIGMNELKEAAMGRDLVLEAVDIKGFFRTIKNFFVQMFERITEAVRKVLAKMDLQAKADKKFVTANKTFIIEGAKADWSVKGYNIGDLSAFYEGSAKADEAVPFIKNTIETLKNAANDKDAWMADIKETQALLKNNGAEKAIAKIFYGLDIENMKDLRKKLHDELFGTEKVELKGKIGANDVIDLLSNERESAKIRSTYSEVKKVYRKLIDEIKKWEATANKADDANLYITGCQLAVKGCKIARSIASTGYSIAISAANYKRSLYRKLAHEFAKAGQSKGKYKPKNESTSLFDAISIL